jgi:hypothetical protein
MALTRPKLSQFDTNIASTSDPITVLNAGSTSANVDVGFLVNRANGLLSNVALYWNEASGAITTAFTANTGSTNSNIAISGYAPISTGNISSISTAVASSTYTTANVSGYQLGMYVNAGLGSIVLGFGTNTSPGTFMTLSASGGKNYIATAYRDFYISDGAGAQPFYITQANGNVTLNSSSSSTSTTTGALVVKGGTGIAGNVHSGGYHYITPTSVTDLAGGSYSSAIIVPGNSWGIYSNVATAGTAYLRQVLGKDSGNNIVVGHSSGTGLVANVNVYAGTSSNSSFNVINGLSNLPMLTVNTTANTVVIANSQSSVSTTTGALQVAGGTGIAGNLYVGGNITVPGVSGQVIFYNSTQHLSSVNSFGELSPLFGGLLSRPLNFVSNTATMRIARPVGTGDPAVELIAFDYGTSAQSTWWDFFAGGDQFNIRRRTNGGANIALTATQYTTYFPTTNVVIQTSTASTSTSSGALQVAGGAGVAGALYAGSVYDTGTRVLSTSSGAGNLSISGTAVTLPLTGPGATTVGSGTAIPVITTDAYGRVVALSTSSVSTTINTAGTTGTGSVSGGGTLTFSSTNGVVVSASGSTIGIATPQDLRSTATPTFTGVTTNGNTIINSTAYINGITSITNNTNSTGAGNGALVVTGGIGASGTVNFGSDLYVSGNIYTANLVATTTSTLNTSKYRLVTLTTLKLVFIVTLLADQQTYTHTLDLCVIIITTIGHSSPMLRVSQRQLLLTLLTPVLYTIQFMLVEQSLQTQLQVQTPQLVR